MVGGKDDRDGIEGHVKDSPGEGDPQTEKEHDWFCEEEMEWSCEREVEHPRD